MKERGILFSGSMARALLNDSKTMTRRACVDQTAKSYAWATQIPVIPTRKHGVYVGWVKDCGHSFLLPTKCPYGAIGDRLWVRETFYVNHVDYDTGPLPKQQPPDVGPELATNITYRADGEFRDQFEDVEGSPRWRSPRFMPRWASRITLEITGVRVERLQEISEADAMAEGVEWRDHAGLSKKTARKLYMALWDQINGDGEWALNKWVWVISFRRVVPS